MVNGARAPDEDVAGTSRVTVASRVPVSPAAGSALTGRGASGTGIGTGRVGSSGRPPTAGRAAGTGGRPRRAGGTAGSSGAPPLPPDRRRGDQGRRGREPPAGHRGGGGGG